MINDNTTRKSLKAPFLYNAISIIHFQIADIHKFIFQYFRNNNVSSVNSI